MMEPVKKYVNIPFLLGVLALSILLALSLGAYRMPLDQMWSSLFDASRGNTHFLMLNIRLPRIILAGAVGAGLAISGTAVQGLFRNPLADQSLIGVSSGAMLFAVLSIVFMGTALSELTQFLKQASVAIFAFGGGLITTFLVYQLSKKNGKTNVMTMLLAGIAITAFAGAITGIFIYLSNDQQLRDITFWSLGSFSGANWVQVLIVLPIVGGGSLVLFTFAKALNGILLGEGEAQYLGIRVERVKTIIIFLTALIVGVCISISGLIGFVGLIIPHFLRLIKGSDYRYLLRSAPLLGAIFLIIADTLARTIIAPAELPIGILTAMVGAPFFLWLLLRSKKHHFSI